MLVISTDGSHIHSQGLDERTTAMINSDPGLHVHFVAKQFALEALLAVHHVEAERISIPYKWCSQ